MARMRFTADHDYRPLPNVLIAYKAGRSYTVKEACATEAEYLQRGVRVEAPPRPASPRSSARRTRGRREAGG